MSNVPDHPVIQHMEQTGFPTGRVPKPPRCPICGSESDTVYVNRDTKQAIGCTKCTVAVDAYDVDECYEYHE